MMNKYNQSNKVKRKKKKKKNTTFGRRLRQPDLDGFEPSPSQIP